MHSSLRMAYLAIVGSFSAGLSSADPTSALASSGLVGGVLGAPLSGMLGDLLGTTVPSFGALVRLAAHDSRLDVLASPHVMTLDNKLATISVGANIPYKSSAGATTAATPYPVQPNIDQEVVVLTKTLTSRPNMEKLLRKANLDQEVGTEHDRELLIERVAKAVQVGAWKENTLSISYRDTDPARAKRVVDVLLSLLEEAAVSSKRRDTERAQQFLSVQIAAYAGEGGAKSFELGQQVHGRRSRRKVHSLA